MARIRNANPRNASGAYERLFGNAELGALVSKIQSGVISSGYELERMIVGLAQNIPDLDDFLENDGMSPDVLLASKRQIQNSQVLDIAGGEPDFMIFKRYEDVQICHVVELKDGHVFDTKKATGEWGAIQGFIERNFEIINCDVRAHFCAFNQDSRTQIQEGFKHRITIEEAMTGREFCDLLGIDYDAIISARRADEDDNLEFFLSELVNVQTVRNRLIELLNE